MNNLLNFSEAATLARCETQWGYAYLLKEDEAPDTNKRGLYRGTLIHVWADRWLRGLGATLPEEWTDDINTGGKPGEVRTLRLEDFDPEDVALALWLASRYTEHYGEAPPADWNIISSEEWLQCTVGGVHLVGRTDGLIETGATNPVPGVPTDGDLWLREVKSAANIKQRLLTIGVEPQPTLYYMLVEANYGKRPAGILYDGVNTYRWVPQKRTLAEIEEEIGPRHTGTKKDLRLVAKRIQETEPGVERPAADSFRREWPDRSDDQLAMGEAFLDAVVARRHALTPRIMPSPPDLALADTIPNIGQACNSCGFKGRCWARLTGLDESEIEVEDDDELEPV